MLVGGMVTEFHAPAFGEVMVARANSVPGSLPAVLVYSPTTTCEAVLVASR